MLGFLFRLRKKKPQDIADDQKGDVDIINNPLNSQNNVNVTRQPSGQVIQTQSTNLMKLNDKDGIINDALSESP
jgi:hypothetical protein